VSVSTALSLLALFVAYLAWRTNSQKLRLDLYDRRFDIYSRTLDFYNALHAWEPTEEEKATTSLRDSPGLRATQIAFIKASREAGFLFGQGSGIQKQLEQMHSDTIWIIGYKRDSHKLNGQPEVVLAQHQRFTERLNRLNETIPALEKDLQRYLDFHAIGRARIW
jgi:hypothetical protein